MQDVSLKARGKFLSWLDNFWYHYKWHSLIALFLVFTLTVCTLQMCAKEDYDIHILYAGNYDIKRTAESGEISEYSTMLGSLCRVSEDFNADGEVLPLLDPLFFLTPAELEEDPPEGMEYNYAMIQQNATALEQNMQYSPFYLCIFSGPAYQYCRAKFPAFFEDLRAVPKGEGVQMPDAHSILLSSTSFGKQPGFQNLPADTVLCVRSLTSVSLIANKNTDTTRHANAMKVLEAMIK